MNAITQKIGSVVRRVSGTASGTSSCGLRYFPRRRLVAWFDKSTAKRFSVIRLPSDSFAFVIEQISDGYALVFVEDRDCRTVLGVFAAEEDALNALGKVRHSFSGGFYRRLIQIVAIILTILVAASVFNAVKNLGTPATPAAGVGAPIAGWPPQMNEQSRKLYEDSMKTLLKQNAGLASLPIAPPPAAPVSGSGGDLAAELAKAR